MSPRPQAWAVIGGGMLGMILARRLAERGEQVTLIEAAERLGGLASAWRLGDVVWDRHYHVILPSDRRLQALLAEIGLAKDLRWVPTQTGFYADGKMYPMSSVVDFLRFPPLGPVDKLRLGLTLLHASRIRDGRRLEGVLVADWLRRWSGQRTLEKIWLPLLRAKLGENYRYASAAFLWAIIARLDSARGRGMKREVLGYVVGGYARILAVLAERLAAEGVRTLLGRRVTQVGVRDGKVTVDVAGAEGARFDRAIVTAAAPVASRLCPGLSSAEQGRLRAIRYQGIVCASLLLRSPLTEFYVTNITDVTIPFTAVIAMSALVGTEPFGGRTLVYLPKYVPPDDPFFERSDDEIRDEFLSALERMFPSFRRDEVLCFRVSRVRHVLAISTLDYSERLPPMETSLPGVHVVNSAHIVNGTLNVNETLELAERAVPRLLAAARDGGESLARLG